MTMTREEATEILADLIDSPFLHTWEKQNKALHMAIEALSAEAEMDGDMGEVSDGYHTFNQLYHQRAVLFATIVKQNKEKAWKSWKHGDGKFCFDSDKEWFIVGVDTPKGSYTYHYEKKYWDMFDCVELEHGKFWDGHTEEDVTRLLSLPSAEAVPHGRLIDADALSKKVSSTTLFIKDAGVFQQMIVDAPTIEPSGEREQPEYCIAYGKGVCGYPIDACCECPKHEYYKEFEKESKPSGDLISRADAVNAVHKYFVDAFNNEPHEIDEDGDDVFTDMKSVNALLRHNKMVSKALKALPSAEAEPTVIRSKTLMPTKDFKEWAKRVKEENEDNVIVIPCDAEVADRPIGDWVDVNGDGSLWECTNCHEKSCCNSKFCGECGAYMKG